MWDVIVLTAGDARQRELFERQLASLPWHKYARVIRVEEDPPGVRIGAGGATLHLLREGKLSNGEHVLLIHSGGLSQRTPHLSTCGKLFALLPSGVTLLEAKLEAYRPFPFILSPGVFLAASDVVEVIPEELDEEVDKGADALLLSHRSSIEVAEQHGVYITDAEGALRTVLQKPSRAAMEAAGAITDGTALTDSAYYLSWPVLGRLARISLPIDCELCAYGDFLRPLGTNPDLSYIDRTSDESLRAWRSALANELRGTKTKLLACGADSFFHFGTLSECLDHGARGSPFGRALGPPRSRAWNSRVRCRGTTTQDPSTTFAEYCDIVDWSAIGERSILSGLHATSPIVIPTGVLLYTVPVRREATAGFVTVLMSLGDDIKAKRDAVQWAGMNTGSAGTLWDARLFPIEPTREASLRSTLSMNEKRNEEGSFKMPPDGVSMADLVSIVNTTEFLEWRQGFSDPKPPGLLGMRN